MTTYNALREATGDEFVRELVQTFLDDAPSLLVALRAAAAQGDAAAFRRAAHTIKSNSSTFGATALAAQARELEHSGLAAPEGTTSDRLTALEHAWSQASHDLQEVARG